ncbi:MAG: hypothetical protein R3C18_12755 [Planctomycetaceae bacterium]
MQRLYSSLFLTSAVLSVLFGLAGESSGQLLGRKNTRYELSADAFVCRGKTISLPFDLDRLSEVLGPPDRTLNLANTIHVWDREGVYVYIGKEETNVKQVSFSIRAEDFEFTPEKQFAPDIIIPGGRVHKGSTRAYLAKLGYEEGYVPSIMARDAGKHRIRVEFDDDTGAVVSVTFSIRENAVE